MEKIYSFWEVMMLPNISRFYNNKYLSAIRHTFYILMPFWLTVSFFDILGNLFLNPFGILMSGEGLNLGFWITGLSGEEYLKSDFVKVLSEYKQIISIGYSLVAVIATAVLSAKLSEIWNTDRRLTVFCSLSAFVLISPLAAHDQNVMKDYFAELGFFSAFSSAFLSAKIFSVLYEIKKLRLKIPKAFPRELSYYLEAVLPVLITLLIFSLLSLIFTEMKHGGEEYLKSFAALDIFQNLFFVLCYQFFVWSLWWLGIPGHSITAKIQEAAYMSAQFGNNTGSVFSIFTMGFFEASVIHVLGLIIAILVFSQHEQWRSISKFSLPFMAFNVQEIFIFGLPVILNPVFLLPYIFAPLANTFVGYMAISWGIVPIFQTDIPWTMPIFVSSIAATHSVMGGILQLVWLVMDIFIYAPFVITANSMHLPEEKKGGEKS